MCHLLHSLVLLFASTGQDLKPSKIQSTWRGSLHVSDVYTYLLIYMYLWRLFRSLTCERIPGSPPSYFLPSCGGEPENKARLHGVTAQLSTSTQSVQYYQVLNMKAIAPIYITWYQQCCWHHAHWPIFLVISITSYGHHHPSWPRHSTWWL